jgi:hypothetical protein
VRLNGAGRKGRDRLLHQIDGAQVRLIGQAQSGAG